MSAWVLGTGGRMPTPQRQTACVLVRDGDRALVLRVGAAAAVARLSLVHLQPRTDAAAITRDARSAFAASEVGVDGCELSLA